MYFRNLTILCERSLYRISSSIRSYISKSSHVSNNNDNKQKAGTIVTKFPDCEVIYTFPYIRYASIFNMTKYRFTILTGASIPISIGLYLADVISFDIAGSVISSGIVTSIWLHSLGILCNNLVGHVYLKLDEQQVILSYLNYRGKRIDLQVSLKEIIPWLDSSRGITDFLYKKIRFFSKDKILKINIKIGQITNNEKFKCTFGIV